MIRRLLPWLAVWALASGLAALTSAQSLELYRGFGSGWAWDLAYNNQCFWALLYGDQTLSVRPANTWGYEGPSIWVRTHLDPIRLLIIPIYAARPGPETLIVVQNVMIWWVIPAAFGLVKSESGSSRLALMAAALVPMTPQLWPLAWNDFREMELAIPFVVWAIDGWRGRRPGLAAFGIVGMILCREEYGVLAAILVVIPPRRAEDVGTTYRWSRAAVVLGLAWMLFAFLGFEWVMVAREAPREYVEHFGGPSLPPAVRARALFELLVFGIGPWSALALLAPRAAIPAALWIAVLSRNRWAEGLLATPLWHLVRYTAPAVALGLAAGLIGFARLGGWALRRRGGRPAMGLLGVAMAAWLLAGRSEVVARFGRIPRPISRAEAAATRYWIGRVAPDDGVIAAYEVTPPLSSRRYLYSHAPDSGRPPGYPRLGPEIRWAFLPPRDLDPSALVVQGFEVVHRGDFLWIYRRPRGG